VRRESSPDRQRGGPGNIKIIDLDLSKYDRIASRFHQEQAAGVSFLKGGIETRNRAFNQLIDRIERVAIVTRDSLLLMGAIPHRSTRGPLPRNLGAFCGQRAPMVSVLPVVPVRKYCAVYYLAHDSYHGMEEVIGSIPIRSTN
jgi:hypothetical protein